MNIHYVYIVWLQIDEVKFTLETDMSPFMITKARYSKVFESFSKGFVVMNFNQIASI